MLNQRGKLFVGGPEIIEFERLLTCDQLLPEGNYPRGMIGNTWPCEVCFRVRESSKPTFINQHSVKLPGNNLLTISAVGPSVERALKRGSNRSISKKHWWRSVLWLLPLPPIFSSWNKEEFKIYHNNPGLVNHYTAQSLQISPQSQIHFIRTGPEIPFLIDEAAKHMDNLITSVGHF